MRALEAIAMGVTGVLALIGLWAVVLVAKVEAAARKRRKGRQ